MYLLSTCSISDFVLLPFGLMTCVSLDYLGTGVCFCCRYFHFLFPNLLTHLLSMGNIANFVQVPVALLMYVSRNCVNSCVCFFCPVTYRFSGLGAFFWDYINMNSCFLCPGSHLSFPALLTQIIFIGNISDAALHHSGSLKFLLGYISDICFLCPGSDWVFKTLLT